MSTVSPIVVTKSRNPVTVFVTKLLLPVGTSFFDHSDKLVDVNVLSAIEVSVVDVWSFVSALKKFVDLSQLWT